MSSYADSFRQHHSAQLSRVAAPLEQAYTLPTQAYLDESLYQLEKEHLLDDVWHPVARVEQVSEPGDFVCLELLGQPLVVVRGRDEEIRVMSTVCLHRAAPVVEGQGKQFRFTCPYHAWTYDLTGQLVRAPLMEEAADFATQKLCLPQATVTVWRGFVMANFAEQPSALLDQINTYDKFFAPFDLQDMEIVATLEYESSWNWKVLVDNFMEAYHHIAIHSSTFEPDFPARQSKIPDNDGPWSILHMPATATGAPSSNANLERWQADDLFATVIFPMFLLAVKDTTAVWYQVLPRGAHDLSLKIHILFPQSYRQLESFADYVEAAKTSTAHVHAEDIAANDMVWRGMQAGMTQQGRLSPYEKSIWQFNQWWLHKLGLSD